MFRSRIVSGALAAGTILVVSCSSSPTTTTTTPTTQDPPQTGTITGRLVDDPVQGVNYATTPDPVHAYPSAAAFTRTTGPNGEYSYNPGDFVIFRIGSLTLNPGATPASGILSPIEIAADNNTLKNLLTLFQSLDADGNPANGIVIPPTAAATFTTTAADTTFKNTLGYFGQDPAVFASSANTLITRAQQAAGITTGIVSPANAGTTFLRQFLQLVALKVWATADASSMVFARADTTGKYLMGQAKASEPDGHPGVEAGRLTAAGFDRYGWLVSTPTLTIDTNGQWGFSDFMSCERLHILGDMITSNDCTGAAGDQVTVMDNNATGIVGAWALGSATNVQVLTLLFFSNGKFGVIDPTGSTATPSCGGPGVEYGSYTYDASTKLLKIAGMLYDTDGCAGLSGTTAATTAGLTFTLSGDGKTATYNDGTARTAYRVSQ